MQGKRTETTSLGRIWSLRRTSKLLLISSAAKRQQALIKLNLSKKRRLGDGFSVFRRKIFNLSKKRGLGDFICVRATFYFRPEFVTCHQELARECDVCCMCVIINLRWKDVCWSCDERCGRLPFLQIVANDSKFANIAIFANIVSCLLLQVQGPRLNHIVDSTNEVLALANTLPDRRTTPWAMHKQFIQ